MRLGGRHFYFSKINDRARRASMRQNVRFATGQKTYVERATMN